MKKLSLFVLVLIVAATIGVVAPVLAGVTVCEEEGEGDDCCGLDCSLCLCCSHVPKTGLSDLAGVYGDPFGQRLGLDGPAKTRAPLKAGVLHVPRCAPVH